MSNFGRSPTNKPPRSDDLRPLILSIPDALYDAISDACSEEFAFSYFSRAALHGAAVMPWTHMAWDRIRADEGAMAVLKRLGFGLKEPDYFSKDREARRQRAAA